MAGALHETFFLQQHESFTCGALTALKASPDLKLHQGRAGFDVAQHDVTPEPLRDPDVSAAP